MDVVQPESGEDYSLRFTFWGSIPPPPCCDAFGCGRTSMRQLADKWCVILHLREITS